MSAPQENDAVGRLRESESDHAPRLVPTPGWVRPFGLLLVVSLVVISVLAAIGANPW